MRLTLHVPNCHIYFPRPGSGLIHLNWPIRLKMSSLLTECDKNGRMHFAGFNNHSKTIIFGKLGRVFAPLSEATQQWGDGMLLLFYIIV